MGSPISTTDYPAFSGATGKRDLIRALVTASRSRTNIKAVIYRIANTDLDALTDKSTVYVPDDNFASA